MRVLISGASGFIGAPLVAHLKEKNCEVVALVRDWNRKTVNLEGFDAVIHLAGEPITFGRWSQSKRNRILSSRMTGTALLSKSLALLHRPPAVFLSASAVGYYGNRGDELLTEGSCEGDGFLAHVCSEWEKGSRSIANRGTRTIHARFGMVLGPAGGALGKLLFFYRLGLGGKIGSGNQWISWIALADLIHALEYLLRKDSLAGPVNIVSPHPIRQKDFASTLARVLHRPSFLFFPAWVLRASLGLMANEILLASQRVEPRKLLASGFVFRYPFLEDALKKGCFFT